MATKANKVKGKSRSSRRISRIIIFSVEILVILVMLLVVVKVFQVTGEEPESGGNAGPHIADFSEEDIVVNQAVKEDPVMKGYWNIALFGVDATNSAELYKSSRSDSMMIASVNLDTGEIKLVSVFRDTYLNIGSDKYKKANAAYKNGGAEQAIAMLNMNLDLDIKDFVTVNYQAVIDVVNGLGGIWIDIETEEEVTHLNNYQASIIRDTMPNRDMEDYNAVTETGYQLLDGLQAAAYCRIRYTRGDDFKRTERQRTVLQAIEDQAKRADLTTLANLFTKVMNNVYTSIKSDDILAMINNINNYQIVDEGGFPKEGMRTTGTIGAVGSCVIPLNLEENVVWLHQFLFGDEEYQVTPEVKKYSDIIKSDTSPYLNQ
ncbi:biofilm regulatory protein A [Lachnospiraceae bacterium]|jgi:LCP family protein required for cell wall assembly|nr:LCP family protein [Lachnospiraceae bacterium]MCX4270782.1 LCP family protein [Acetatifactor sp.]GFH94162.1 biofilm regulatory protein A [Lachnospiraceae bacterium]